MILPLVFTSLAIAITFGYASYLDIRDRRVPFPTWYPMLIVGIPLAVLFYGNLILSDFSLFLRLGIITALFCGLFYLFAAFHLFGGADAWALIFIAALIPVFPIEPAIFGYPPLRFFAFTVLTNAVLLNLMTPLGIFLLNLRRGNVAPFPYMFFGFPVPADRLERYFGFVMEEMSEKEGRIERRFLTVRESLSKMVHGEDRLYTKNIRLHPEQYTRERALFLKAGHLWISYGVPFIVPITAGFVTALLAGDMVYVLIRMAVGI